ncbi:extensin-like [Nicotiana sylvestris]|uniref:extensin-like n=1 Tax=Nicotiana sylvestris TaxID=4096 RepID=UPI00388C5027
MGSPGSNINALMNLFQQSHLTTPIQDPPTSNATMGAFAVSDPTPTFFEDIQPPAPTPSSDQTPPPPFISPSPPPTKVPSSFTPSPSFVPPSAPSKDPAPLRHSTRVTNPFSYLKDCIYTSINSAVQSKISPPAFPFHEPQHF